MLPWCFRGNEGNGRCGKAKVRISKRSIDALKAQEADYFVWDKDLPGFGVRVFASGRKSYLVQYRNPRRTGRITLGLHGALTPEDARKLAKVHLGAVAKGGDPAEVRKLDREGMTVAELCDRYLADAERGLVPGKRRMPKKPSTLATDRSRIDAHIKPLLGTRLVKEVGITDPHVFQEFARKLGRLAISARDHLQAQARRVALAPVEEVATATYNGQFPGPLLRFSEGRPVTVDIRNDTTRPEQLHWHGQTVSVEVDGAAEEGTPPCGRRLRA
jgi:hypothetical protein